MAAMFESCSELSNKLLVMNPNVDDFNSGRCRLSRKLMKEYGLNINDAVSVHIHEHKVRIFCTIWPQDFGPEHVIYVDTSVVLPDNTAQYNNVNVKGCRICLETALKRVQKRLAKIVNVTVYVSSDDCKSINPRLYYNKTRREAQTRCILQDRVFTQHCWVHVRKLNRCGFAFVQEIDRININNVEYHNTSGNTHEQTAAFISNETQIIVKAIKSHKLNRNVDQSFCRAAYGQTVDIIDHAIKLSLLYPNILDNIDYIKSFLLLGPPGVGKTSLVIYLVEQWQAELFMLSNSDIFSSHMGESEQNLRNIFSLASEAAKHVPCVIFLDEIDTICPKRAESSDVERRVTSTLLTLIDETASQRNIILIAATNRPNALDSAVRRPGRFDKEFVIGVPSCAERLEILKCLTSNLPLCDNVTMNDLAQQCLGYVAADLAALVRQSTMNAINTTEEMIGVNKEHFAKAFREIVPSTYRGMNGLVEHTPIQWQDIGGYENVKQVLKQGDFTLQNIRQYFDKFSHVLRVIHRAGNPPENMAIEWPFLYPEAFLRFGLTRPRGILLYGPPGCSKTMLVRAAATSCNCTFLSLSCAQLFSPYVGDAEKLLREVFIKARAAAPTILFLDEVDVVVRKRSKDGSCGVESRILATLLNEIDGVGISSNIYDKSTSTSSSSKMLDHSPQKSILFVAATNRPEVLDEAILRPGRIDRVLYVPQPDENTRREILSVYCKKIPLHQSVDIDLIAKETERFSGADLKNLCREATLNALQEMGLKECRHVEQKHFIEALTSTSSSLTQSQIQNYESMQLS